MSGEPPKSEDLSTVPRRVGLPAAEGPASFAVSVVEGPDLGARLVVDGSHPSRVLVGQSPACVMRLSDRQVSRRHAALELLDRSMRITDLGSTNGTTVNGVMIADAFLFGGEIVRLGATALRIDAVSTQSPSLPQVAGFGRVIGASPEMRRLYGSCERLAASNVPVLIEGETGTGKELLAESIHEKSARGGGPFVVYDARAVPPQLAEVVLFGRADGRKGLFDQANGGTLFIDELGELDVILQGRLMRVLERGELVRIGANDAVRVDVRIIAATRRDLDKDVQTGRFRDDLFFQFAPGRVELPPLRRRQGDVAVLAEAFFRELGEPGRTLPDEFLPRFEGYDWPGNVRELRGALVRFLTVGEPATRADKAPEERAPAASIISDPVAFELPFPRARQRVLDAFRREYVERLLARHGGNIRKAAAASGIARRYFQLLKSRPAK